MDRQPVPQLSPLRLCEHRQSADDDFGPVACSLIPLVSFAAADSPNCICRNCQPSDTPQGKPTGVVAWESTANMLGSNPANANRHPAACDHSGRVIEPGATCVSRIFECSQREDGRANCATCRDCPDFIPVGGQTIPGAAIL